MAQRAAPRTPTITAAMAGVWRPWLPDPTTWAAWTALLKAAFGEPLTDAELEVSGPAPAARPRTPAATGSCG